jgi:hypothetical protein
MLYVKIKKKISILGGLRPPITPLFYKSKREGVIGG